MWQCRSPRRSSTRDELGQRAARPRPRAPRGPRAARAGPRVAERRVDLLLGRAAHRLARGVVEDPVLGDVQPAAHRASRSSTLWALEPVRCCRTLPNWSGSTTLRSTFMPVWVVARARVVARPTDRLDQRQLRQRPGARADRRGRDDVEVLDRVGQPAQGAGDLDAVGAGCARRAPDDLLGQPHRPGAARAAAGPVVAAGEDLEEFSSTLAPKPRRPRIWPLGRRAQRLQRVDAELVEQPARPLGAEARQVHDRDQPGGYFAAQLARPGCPRLDSARSFLSSVLPIPELRGAALPLARRPTRRRRAPPWPRCGTRSCGRTPRRRARRGRRARRRRRRSARW